MFIVILQKKNFLIKKLINIMIMSLISEVMLITQIKKKHMKVILMGVKT